MKPGPGRIIALVITLLFLVALMPKSCAQTMLPHRHYAGGLFVNPCDHQGYIIMQNFEGTGYDHCETWTSYTGTGLIDPDYTGVVLEGSQSCLLAQTNNWMSVYPSVFTVIDEVWSYFLLRPLTNDTSAVRVIASFGPSDLPTASIQTTTTSHFRVAVKGGTSVDTVATFSTGTTYHIWLHYKRGTGASDDEADIGFSTDGTRPTTGNNYATTGNGNSDAQVQEFNIGRFNTAATLTMVFDKVRVKSSQIGDNPP